ncbi:hypothetical protein Mal64_16290 [Pseudobythopirellula maris]|uniref:N-acetyltransferase domain-containing protein n=1 Tax=Pseudobythopirellula maris TaxID=2527991 RepID=A0A5C5ZL40_9BACT|nr:N-acetyltransferase [Pseudobythopirellula maris]TWT88152.1 hypothetical protein Mal64_16290 [Pseudobythopirellula maris]
MAGVEILPVSSKADQKRFLTLPWKLNAHDPNWVPPLRDQQKRLCGFAHHPFYDAAESQAFLAVRGGEAVGRILAVDNQAHNDWNKEKRGFYGFFESVDDQAVSGALFDAAADWHRDRGMTALRGPTDPCINYEMGLLVDGFDTPPFFMLTHNPQYYGPLHDAYGFEKAQDLYGYWGEKGMLGRLKRDEKMKNIDEQVQERFGVSVRGMKRGKFRQEVEMFLDIYNQALSATWGYVPMSRSEVLHMAAELKYMIVPELARIAEVDGKPVGVMFGLLDYNTRIKQIDGRLFPFGFARLLMNKRGIKRIRLVSTNVLPEYQNWGVGVCLARSMTKPALDHGVTACEFSWVLETNDLSRKTIEKGGARRYKTWRIYDKEL